MAFAIWHKKEPWERPRDDKRDEHSNQYKKDSEGLPDLEELFKKFLSKLSGGGQSYNPNNSNNLKLFSGKIIGIIVVVAVIIWGLSGFYTIREAEQGVVLRFGKLQSQVVPAGLNWKPTFIDRVIPINIREVSVLKTGGSMLTRDENMVTVEMNVHYRIYEPAKFLFSVTNPNDTLVQATDSALRYVVGHMTMDDIVTKGRSEVKDKTWKLLNEIIKAYDMGLEVLDVNFQSARPPEEVKEAFDDAIKAQEDEQRFVKEAEAYAKGKEPIAKGDARRIVEQAVAYKDKIVLEAQGNVARFSKLLPEYNRNPTLLKERLYIDSMEKVLSHNPKIIAEPGGNLNILPLDKILSDDLLQQKQQQKQQDEDNTDKGGK